MFERLAALVQTLFIVGLIAITLIVSVYLSYISIPLIILSVIGILTYTYFINRY